MSNDISPRTTLIIFVLIMAMLVVGGVLLLISRPDPVQITINPPLPTATPAPTDTPEPILVYVTGAVNEPEITVTLPYGSRVADALAAAGGVTDDADMERVNVAGIVHDGDQIHVPSLQAAADSDTDEAAGLPTPSGGAVVYINTATLEELETLPGVGPATAQRIIDYRTENGNFTSMEDLDNVSGIGPAMLESLQGLISFE